MTLTKLIELQAAATTGPWKIGFDDGSGKDGYITTTENKTIVSGGVDDWGIRHGVGNDADAALITAARNFDFAALDAKIKRYEDALRFYAVTDNHKPQVKPKIGYCAVWEDEGERARKALEGME